MNWNQRYQEKDTPWDKGKAAPPLLDYLKNNTLAGRVLVPGCGTGADARAIAAQGAEATGIDIAPLAIEKAQSYPAPKNGTLSFQLCDFFDPDAANKLSGKFDYLFEHTCFCAIDPSQRNNYVHSAKRLIKDGGHLLGIFFAHLTDPDGPPYPTNHDEIEKLFSPHFVILRHWRPARCFPEREDEEAVYLMQKRPTR